LPNNFHYLDIGDDFHEQLSKLTDCIVALDEGYFVFNSYKGTKFPMRAMQNVLHTRHFDRSIWITAQRPTNVHVTFRGNVNAFYKCTKLMSWPFVLFKKEEFDLNSKEEIDEMNCFSRKFYIGKNEVFTAYDSKYLRGDTPLSQDTFLQIFILQWKEISGLLGKKFSDSVRSLMRTHRAEAPTGGKLSTTAIKTGVGSILQTPADSERPTLF